MIVLNFCATLRLVGHLHPAMDSDVPKLRKNLAENPRQGLCWTDFKAAYFTFNKIFPISGWKKIELCCVCTVKLTTDVCSLSLWDKTCRLTYYNSLIS